LRQAQACHMRSNCRCSCVLRFTLSHAFSCVLHRPPSQLIHCMALYFVSLQIKQTTVSHRKKINPRLPGTPERDAWAATVRNYPGPPTPTRAQDPIPNRFGVCALSHRQVTGAGSAPKGRSLRLQTQTASACTHHNSIFNDPSAGSPTETLLRLLLPLNVTVWPSSRHIR
jgi:hypothetical protein